MANTKFNYAAAYGITAQTAATWATMVPRTPRVIVPVGLQVLMVRQGAGVQWADCGMRVPTTDPGTVVEASTMMPAPFSQLTTPRLNGAYLLWSLPDALTAGTVTDSTGDFPAIPDRWLVLRICPSKTNRLMRSAVGWVLQSGDPVPQQFDLATWTEPGVPPNVKKPLTAMGHGEAAWAAIFDNVKQRLGFFDSLSDCPEGPIAYLVCGWYSDGSLDPLGDPDIHSLADFNAAMQQLQWSVPDNQFHEAVAASTEFTVAAEAIGLTQQLTASAQAQANLPFDTHTYQKPAPGSTPAGPPYVTDGSWWPQASIYSGSCLGIGWPGVGWPGNDQGLLSQEVGGVPPAKQINVAIGGTLAEALAVLVGKATGQAQEARILEAFQLGMLPELDQADGRARLDALLRASAFASMSAGTVDDRVWQAASGPPVAPPANPATPAPGIFSRNLTPNRRVLAKNTANTNLQKTTAAPLNPHKVVAKASLQEANLAIGGIEQIIGSVNPTPSEPSTPGQWVDVERALPRYFYPTDPVVLLQDAGRSFQYGNDGRYAADGTLICRLSGCCLHSYARPEGDIFLPAIVPSQVLDNGVTNGSVPPECNDLLGEAAILDPGSAGAMVDASSPPSTTFTAALRTQAISYVMADQTAIHALRDPRVDHSAVLAHSGFQGVIPSPVSIGLPTNPWSPVYLEWQIAFTPSATPMQDWQLGETDFNESAPIMPPAGAKPLHFQGRCPVNDTAGGSAAAAVRATISQIQSAVGTGQLPPSGIEQFGSQLVETLLTTVLGFQAPAQNSPDADSAQLEDIATTLESMDILGATFNQFQLALRGGYYPDGQSAPPAGSPMPSPFFIMRAGFLQVLRLRLVDGFGQFVDLAGTTATQAADPNQLLLADTLQVPQAGVIGLPPRFTAPARIWFRFKDAAGSIDPVTGEVNDASLTTDQAPGLSPVCGYLMPNHLDGSLEFFGADASNLGEIGVADDNSIIWEDAPGTPSTLGTSPSLAIPDPHLGAFGDALVRWGTADAGVPNQQDNALQALLRVVDSTLWSVDPFGHTGDEHMALLVGHPVVVMRASLRLDLQEPVDPNDALLMQVPVRLGALAHWQDGLLGYFVNDDYSTLYCSDAAAAGLARDFGPGRGFLQQVNLVPEYYAGFAAAALPVTHPYINTSGVMWVHPGQEVKLTLLMEPLTVVHATSGIVPRKEIGMRREWVTLALAQLAPTFRFGPVLVDPQKVRMPIASELNGTWTWSHRQDIITWASDAVTNATQDATLAPDPPVGSEGWLRLGPPPAQGGTQS
jgi:hypothetical protein